MMETSKQTNLELEKVFSHLEKIKPDFGTITLDLIYHQSRLAKVRFLQKEDVIVLEKSESKAGKDPRS